MRNAGFQPAVMAFPDKPTLDKPRVGGMSRNSLDYQTGYEKNLRF